jgi:hypothetical protein
MNSHLTRAYMVSALLAKLSAKNYDTPQTQGQFDRHGGSLWHAACSRLGLVRLNLRRELNSFSSGPRF